MLPPVNSDRYLDLLGRTFSNLKYQIDEFCHTLKMKFKLGKYCYQSSQRWILLFIQRKISVVSRDEVEIFLVSWLNYSSNSVKSWRSNRVFKYKIEIQVIQSQKCRLTNHILIRKRWTSTWYTEKPKIINFREKFIHRLTFTISWALLHTNYINHLFILTGASSSTFLTIRSSSAFICKR